MKNLTVVLVLFLVSCHTNSPIQEDVSNSNESLHDNSRIKGLDSYWVALARTAKEGDFEGMKSLYHEHAVLVKPDTTIAISEAFKFRWKKEIMEVKNGKRANAVEFRFSKRIGNEITALEKGIYHYRSVETVTGNILGDSYTHFETLLVKVNDKWVALMEYQIIQAAEDEWNSLE